MDSFWESVYWQLFLSIIWSILSSIFTTWMFLFVSKLESFFLFFLKFYFIFKLYIIVLVCQISKWIRHRYTCVPHPEPSSLLPPHTIPLGCPSALAPSIQYRALNLDWHNMIDMIVKCPTQDASSMLFVVFVTALVFWLL